MSCSIRGYSSATVYPSALIEIGTRTASGCGSPTRVAQPLDETRAEMKRILADIQEGRFAKEWLSENQVGRPVYNARKRRDSEHLIEDVGAKLRAMMSWLDNK